MTGIAQIYCGLRDGYDISDARRIVHDYVRWKSLCVSLTETEFIHEDGCGPGVIVGLIKASPHEIRDIAQDLGMQLVLGLGQYCVSIVFPDDTIMLEAAHEQG